MLINNFLADSGLPGRPRIVATFCETNATIDDLSFRQILLHPLVKNRKIVAVSIVGIVKKGKSFLLDYMLRYLYYNVSGIVYLHLVYETLPQLFYYLIYLV
jgi:hypothetical protein